MKSRIYFSGIDGIRFWAALFVVFWHIEQYKRFFGITARYEDSFFLNKITMSGSDAVILFFVLSGFLITYLLLVEIERTQDVSIKNFYIRRTLRIWPLYYLLVFIGFVLIPIIIKLTNFDGYYVSVSNRLPLKLALYMTFLPNVAQVFSIFPVAISHLWTIGVEEYFYLLWPQLIKRVRNNILPAIFGVFLVRLIILGLVYFRYTLTANVPISPQGLDLLILVASKFPFEAMAMGGLAAYIYYHKKETILNILYHRITVVLILALLFLNMLFSSTRITPYTLFLGSFVITAFYAIFILNLATNPNFPLKLDNAAYLYLGKLSYGIYMYHVVWIYLILIGFDKIGWTSDGLFYNLILYSIVVAMTIITSHFSYQRFEKPFLKMKESFSIVKSGQALSSETDS